MEDTRLESPATSLPDLVWYASYGSNLNRARFMAYIEGGSPPGTGVVYKGSRDTSPPLDDVSLELPQSLYFAGWSERPWGGTAAAFITLEGKQPPALARAYLIARQQFADVVAQENEHASGSEGLKLDLEEARRFGHARMLPSGFYSELIYCGNRDGFPMLSFTSSEDRTDHNAPSPAYLRMIHSGLHEAHGFSVEDSVGYFKDRPGVLGQLTVQQLLEILTLR